MQLTHSDVEGEIFLQQAVSSSDNPAFAENGATAEHLASGTLHQGDLSKSDARRAVVSLHTCPVPVPPSHSTCHGISPGITKSPPTMRL